MKTSNNPYSAIREKIACDTGAPLDQNIRIPDERIFGAANANCKL
jgi:hypothetical protein